MVDSLAPLVSLSSVQLERGGQALFDSVSFSLCPGELWVIQGANGQGKSSLLRAIAGLDQPSQGKVVFHVEPSFAWLSHHLPLKNNLTGEENARRLLLLFGLSVSQDTSLGLKQALQRMGLWSKRRNLVGSYSAGMKRRLYLAVLSLHTASIWLLDEPQTSLDVAGQALLESLLLERLAEGKAIIMTSHWGLSERLAGLARPLVLEACG